VNLFTKGLVVLLYPNGYLNQSFFMPTLSLVRVWKRASWLLSLSAFP